MRNETENSKKMNYGEMNNNVIRCTKRRLIIASALSVFLSLSLTGCSLTINIDSPQDNTGTQQSSSTQDSGSAQTEAKWDGVMRLCISDDATDKEIKELEKLLIKLKKDEGYISSIDFLDKDEVLEDFQHLLENDPNIIHQLDGRPLPRMFTIAFNDSTKAEAAANTISESKAFIAIAEDRDDPLSSIHYGHPS